MRFPLLLPALLLAAGLTPVVGVAASDSAGTAAAPDTVAGLPDATPEDAAAAAPDTAAAPARVPFGLGERLVFSIDYGPINAGEGVLEVQGLVESQGRTAYQIESRATSNRVFSTFYKVRDRIVTHLDVRRLQALYFSKRLREGSYRKNVEIVFDQEAGKAYYADGRVFDVEPGIQDALSAFYWVRTLDLEAGRTYGVMTHSSRKNYELQVIVHGRESVTVPAGTFDCWVVEPVLLDEGLFQHEGKLTIWLSADADRIPVLMRTRVKVGSIDASLTEYQLGIPLPADLTAAPAAGGPERDEEDD